MVLTTKLLSCLAVISAIVMAGCEASAEIAEPNEGSKLLALPSSATSQHDMIRSLRSDDSGVTARNEERGPTISSGGKPSISQWSAHLLPNKSAFVGKRLTSKRRFDPVTEDARSESLYHLWIEGGGHLKELASITSSPRRWNKQFNPSGKTTAGLGGKPPLDSPSAGATRASHLSSENANERVDDGSLVEKFGRLGLTKDGLDGNVDKGKATADAGAGTAHAAM